MTTEWTNVFSFRNSQYIDLFPVFIKDIHPFILTQDKSEYISNIYDNVMKGIKRHGRSNKIEESYQARIDKFNSKDANNSTYHRIKKPQTYFNEAKLTAIALSIRFALLDTTMASNGRFWH